MKWTLKLVAEVVPGKPTEYEVATFERIEKFSPATVGLTISEGKAILAGLQKQMAQRRFNIMAPAFTRVRDAERRSARRATTSPLFGLYTVTSACASAACGGVLVWERARTASRLCSLIRIRPRPN